jgi:hypothetical protein
MGRAEDTDVPELLVDSNKPDLLDRALQHLGALVAEGDVPGTFFRHEGHLVVRCFGNEAFIRFAIENQGYGVVVGEGRFTDG